MQINLVLIIVILLLLGGAIKGYQNGIVKEVSTLIGLIGALAAGMAIITALKHYQTQNTVNVVIAVICLIVILLAYKIIDFVLASLKMLSKIPVISWINKLLGGAAGIGEGILIVWIAFLLLTAFDIAGIRSFVLTSIKEDRFLSYLFYHNYLMRGITELGHVKDVIMEIL